MAAITFGDSIHFKKDTYDASTLRGITLIAHEIAHSQQYRTVGFATFLNTYAANSASVLATPRGLLASAIAATKGINLPHAQNVYEQAANFKAERVWNYLASLCYGEKGMACLQ